MIPAPAIERKQALTLRYRLEEQYALMLALRDWMLGQLSSTVCFLSMGQTPDGAFTLGVDTLTLVRVACYTFSHAEWLDDPKHAVWVAAEEATSTFLLGQIR